MSTPFIHLLKGSLNTSVAGASAAGSRQIKLADAKTKLPGTMWPAVELRRMNEKRS
jgi:hypothetical protein